MKVAVKIAGDKYNESAEGFAVGPFVVHRAKLIISGHLPKWGVTHAATGYNAAYGPTKACCMHAARRLRDVGVDWSFDRPSAVSEFSEDHLSAIHVIRSACAQGGEA